MMFFLSNLPATKCFLSSCRGMNQQTEQNKNIFDAGFIFNRLRRNQFDKELKTSVKIGIIRNNFFPN